MMKKALICVAPSSILLVAKMHQRSFITWNVKLIRKSSFQRKIQYTSKISVVLLHYGYYLFCGFFVSLSGKTTLYRWKNLERNTVLFQLFSGKTRQSLENCLDEHFVKGCTLGNRFNANLGSNKCSGRL